MGTGFRFSSSKCRISNGPPPPCESRLGPRLGQFANFYPKTKETAVNGGSSHAKVVGTVIKGVFWLKFFQVWIVNNYESLNHEYLQNKEIFLEISESPHSTVPGLPDKVIEAGGVAWNTSQDHRRWHATLHHDYPETMTMTTPRHTRSPSRLSPLVSRFASFRFNTQFSIYTEQCVPEGWPRFGTATSWRRLIGINHELSGPNWRPSRMKCTMAREICVANLVRKSKRWKWLRWKGHPCWRGTIFSV